MPVRPRGRGRLHLEMPDVKPGQVEDTEAAQEPSVYISPKKIISLSLKSTERQLSISEEPVPKVDQFSDTEDENDPLAVFKQCLRKQKGSFIMISAEFLCNPDTTQDMVIEWVQYVMRRCLASVDLCITFSSHFKTLIQHRTFGKVIKKITIDYLQEYYEERATSFEDKPADFNGSVTLLGQIFLRYQIKGKPLRVFAQPLLECLLMMCNKPNEENVKIIAEQISFNGKTLEGIVPEMMTQLIVAVQRHLLNTTSDNLRTWLLLITDLCFYGQPLSPEIIEIFSTTIGLHTINAMAPPSEDKLHGEIPAEFTQRYASRFPE